MVQQRSNSGPTAVKQRSNSGQTVDKRGQTAEAKSRPDGGPKRANSHNRDQTTVKRRSNGGQTAGGPAEVVGGEAEPVRLPEDGQVPPRQPAARSKSGQNNCGQKVVKTVKSCQEHSRPSTAKALKLVKIGKNWSNLGGDSQPGAGSGPGRAPPLPDSAAQPAGGPGRRSRALVTAGGHGLWSRPVVTVFGHGRWSRSLVTAGGHGLHWSRSPWLLRGHGLRDRAAG